MTATALWHAIQFAEFVMKKDKERGLALYRELREQISSEKSS